MLVPWYYGTRMAVPVERVQTGVRLERRMLKVLKALAEYLDLSLGDLLEGIVLHAFAGRGAFGTETLAEIAKLRSVYGLTLTAEDSHRLVERAAAAPRSRAPTPATPSRRRQGARGRSGRR